MSAVDSFKFVLIFSKIVFIIGLIILSYKDVHVGYINDKPRSFMNDCLVTGATGGLALLIISGLRGSFSFDVGIMTFLLLFVLNVLLEFSGFNSVSVNSANATQTENNEEKVLKWPVIVGSTLTVLLLVYFAYQANVPLTNSSLLLEVLIFGIASGVSSAYVSKNHGASQEAVYANGIGSGVLFGLVHVALQKGGFYNYSVFA